MTEIKKTFILYVNNIRVFLLAIEFNPEAVHYELEEEIKLAEEKSERDKRRR